MIRRSALKAGAIGAAIAAAAALSGCGKMGSLERPGPMFGHGNSATPPQARQQQDPNRPIQTVDPRDESATPAPPRTLPIPGQSPNPIGVAPQGALPDPYANPPR